jgi:hypothetical protein
MVKVFEKTSPHWRAAHTCPGGQRQGKCRDVPSFNSFKTHPNKIAQLFLFACVKQTDKQKE